MAKTARDNTFMFFEDFSDFITSKLYKKNKSIITKYQPVKKYFNATPEYKPFRIVLKSTGYENIQGNHTTYTIDADESNFDSIVEELENLGAITANDFYSAFKSGREREIGEEVEKEDTSFKTGEKQGQFEEQQAEASQPESGWDGFVSGFTAPIQLALGNKELLGLGLSL
jgi:hypothetical protein